MGWDGLHRLVYHIGSFLIRLIPTPSKMRCPEAYQADAEGSDEAYSRQISSYPLFRERRTIIKHKTKRSQPSLPRNAARCAAMPFYPLSLTPFGSSFRSLTPLRDGVPELPIERSFPTTPVFKSSPFQRFDFLSSAVMQSAVPSLLVPSTP